MDEQFARNFGLDPALGREGMSLEQVVATVHPEDLSGLQAAIAGAIERGGAYAHQYRVRRRDGRYYWIEANGRVDLAPDGTALRFPGVLLDVEARRVAEAERDRAMRLLKAFVDAVPGVVYAKDRQGRMLVGNRGTSELIGKPPEDYLGLTDAEFLDDEAQGLAIMANDRRIMESGETEQVEEEVRLADGSPAVWLSTKAPMRDPDGRIVGLIGSSLDITERKAAEARAVRKRGALPQHGRPRPGDDVGDAARRRLHLPNRAVVRVHRADPEEAEGFGWLEATHPDDRAVAERAFRRGQCRAGAVPGGLPAAAGRRGLPLGHRRGGAPLRDGRGVPGLHRLGHRHPRAARRGGPAARERGALPDPVRDHRVGLLHRRGPAGRATSRGSTTAWSRPTPPSSGRRAFPRPSWASGCARPPRGWRRHWFETYGRVARTGEPTRFEQGSALLGRWFDVYAFRLRETAEGRVGILFNDISARRNAEEALRELNETLEQPRRGGHRRARRRAEEALRQSAEDGGGRASSPAASRTTSTTCWRS